MLDPCFVSWDTSHMNNTNQITLPFKTLSGFFRLMAMPRGRREFWDINFRNEHVAIGVRSKNFLGHGLSYEMRHWKKTDFSNLTGERE